MSVPKLEIDDRTPQHLRLLPVVPVPMGEEETRFDLRLLDLSSRELINGTLRSPDSAAPEAMQDTQRARRSGPPACRLRQPRIYVGLHCDASD